MKICKALFISRGYKRFIHFTGDKQALSRNGKARSATPPGTRSFSVLGKALAALVFSVHAGSVIAQASDAEEVRAIARLYSAAFDREPEVGGLNFWVNSYENGSSLTAVP